jgi:hypothetical protein
MTEDELLRGLGLCFVRAAVAELLAEAEDESAPGLAGPEALDETPTTTEGQNRDTHYIKSALGAKSQGR